MIKRATRMLTTVAHSFPAIFGCGRRCARKRPSVDKASCRRKRAYFFLSRYFPSARDCWRPNALASRGEPRDRLPLAYVFLAARSLRYQNTGQRICNAKVRLEGNVALEHQEPRLPKL